MSTVDQFLVVNIELASGVNILLASIQILDTWPEGLVDMSIKFDPNLKKLSRQETPNNVCEVDKQNV